MEKNFFEKQFTIKEQNKLGKVLNDYLKFKRLEKQIKGIKSKDYNYYLNELNAICGCASLMIFCYGEEKKAIKYLKKELGRLANGTTSKRKK